VSHWYDKDGSPQYEVKSKSGPLRSTTLRDARKFEWVPSVSTIWKDVVAAPGLNRYYQEQLFNVMVVQFDRGYSIGDEQAIPFKRRVFALAKEHAMKAAERGTHIHNLLEQQLLTGKCGSKDPNEIHMVMQTIIKMKEVCGDQDWKVEKSFAHPMGYGGKIDVYSDEWVVDFKTKELVEGKKPDMYDSYGVQLAAYNHGVGGGRKLLNLFVSVSSPGYVVDHEWEERERLFSMFEAALNLWKLTKRYDASWQA
tara:strand:+ start:69 stop:827 length:759 start_codon:yes stop_codon:yes gene_type:complete